MSEKLKPCPFCGGETKSVKRNVCNEKIYFIKCYKCGATISFDNLVCNNNPIKALDYFNRRNDNGKV